MNKIFFSLFLLVSVFSPFNIIEAQFYPTGYDYIIKQDNDVNDPANITKEQQEVKNDTDAIDRANLTKDQVLTQDRANLIKNDVNVIDRANLIKNDINLIDRAMLIRAQYGLKDRQNTYLDETQVLDISDADTADYDWSGQNVDETNDSYENQIITIGNGTCEVLEKTFAGYINYIGCIIQRYIFSFLIALAIVGFLYGVITKLIIKSTDTNAHAEAGKYITWSLIGFFVIVSVLSLVLVIQRTIGIEPNSKDSSQYQRLQNNIKSLK
jgi:hypothetical protein